VAVGGQLTVNADALNGFAGAVSIGGYQYDNAGTLVVTTVSSDVTIANSLNVTVAPGTEIAVWASGDILFTGLGATLTADTVTLGGVGTGSAIINATGQTAGANTPGIAANTGYIIGVEAIGVTTTGQQADIKFDGLNGVDSVLEIATTSSQAFIAKDPVNLTVDVGSTTFAFDLVSAAGLATSQQLALIGSGNVLVTSVSQSSAAKEQSGGLVDEGFIDPSLFQEISLYDTAGTGIALPADQREEECQENDPTCVVQEDEAATTPN
jgi:hypothetical protein